MLLVIGATRLTSYHLPKEAHGSSKRRSLSRERRGRGSSPGIPNTWLRCCQSLASAGELAAQGSSASNEASTSQGSARKPRTGDIAFGSAPVPKFGANQHSLCNEYPHDLEKLRNLTSMLIEHSTTPRRQSCKYHLQTSHLKASP